jgi:DNA-binding response OmpR family regulator
LLEELSANAGEALTDKHLLTKVWGPDYTDDRQYLYEYIKRLRAKIEPNPAKPIFIIIVPGVGYRFDRDKKRNDSA